MTDEHLCALALKDLAWLQRRFAKISSLARLAQTELYAARRSSAAYPLMLIDLECRQLAEDARSLLLKVAPPAANDEGNHG